MIRYILLWAALLSSFAQAGSARRAAEIVANYERSVSQWSRELKAADSPELQEQVWARRPDANAFGVEIWGQLQGSLREEWMLSYAPSFLELAPAFALKPRNGVVPSRQIVKAVELFHLRSPQVGRLCLALTVFPDPETLATIEKIAASTSDQKVQGQAALAQAFLLKNLGDEGENMKKRLELLREAIIKSADVRVGENTVADLAESELFAIQNLRKGSEAPNLLGRDIAGRPMALHSMRGKVVVLVFWRSWMAEADRVLEILQKFHREYQGRPVELVGVAQMPSPLLRKLRADGTIPWRNFHDPENLLAKQYQVQEMPLVYVLDRKGMIQYIGNPGSFVDLTVEALLADG